MAEKINIWIIHPEKRILVSDLPGGPPAVICGFVSVEAAQAARERGYPTVSEIGFPVDCHLSAPDWTEANRLAEQKAAELGYTISQESWEGELAAALAGDYPDEDEDQAFTCETCGEEFGDGWSTCGCDDDGDESDWDDEPFWEKESPECEEDFSFLD